MRDIMFHFERKKTPPVWEPAGETDSFIVPILGFTRFGSFT
jgi:hypothetical protein